MQINFCLIEVFFQLADSLRVSDHFLNCQLVVLDLLGELRKVVSLIANLCLYLHVLLLNFCLTVLKLNKVNFNLLFCLK